MSLFGDIAGFLTAGRAASAIGNANINAEHGVIDATNAGAAGIQSQIGKAYGDVGQAGANVNAATDSANSNLQNYLNGIQGNLAPSIQSGVQGNQQLQQYAASNPQFNFNLKDYLNSDALKFQMDQGTNAITNAASAQGLGTSGNTMKSLEQYGQGLASTYYNDAFSRAQNQFQTNQNATLSNLSALISSGNTGNALNNQATLGIGGQQAQNTIGAANTNANLQQYLASLGLQGNEFGANLGLQGATTAGNFAVGAGNARAAGITGQGAALASGAGDLGSLVFGGGPLGQASSIVLGGKP